MGKRFIFHQDRIRYAVLFLVVLCAALLSRTGIRAYAEEQKLICSEEIAQYCKGVKPGGGRLLLCLKEHEKDLTPTCREKVAEVEKRLKETLQICAADTEKFCKGIQPGEGRIAKCLNEHSEEISLACREKVSGLKKMKPETKPEQ
ncbi:MAG: cysteine rich repeat-containing protein [Thermodesulfovibrionales bacterium]